MNAHLASACGFELDQALRTRRRLRDQLDKSGPARCLRFRLVSRAQQPFQFAGVEAQLLGGPVDALLPGSPNGDCPQLVWDRRFPRTATSPLLEARSRRLDAAGLYHLLRHPLLLTKLSKTDGSSCGLQRSRTLTERTRCCWSLPPAPTSSSPH